MAKVYIIGASGLVGRYLFNSLDQRELIGTSTGRVSSKLIQFNLENPLSLSHLIESDDLIIFASAISSPDRCTAEYEKAFNINVTATSQAISDYLNTGARVVFLSSDAVYGDSATPVNETSSPNPKGHYGEMKVAIEDRFLNEVNFKTVRLSYVFSNDDNFTSYLRQCANSNVPAKVFQKFRRSVVSITDIAIGLKYLDHNWLKVPMKVFNFSGPEFISREQFAFKLQRCEYKNLEIDIVNAPSGFFEQRAESINMQSLHFSNLLGKNPTSIEESLKIQRAQGTIKNG